VTIRLITAFGLVLAAICLGAPTALGSGGYSGQAYRAVVAKSQAEDNRYGGHDGYSFQALQAVDARGKAMNQRYGGTNQSPAVLDGRSPDTKDAAFASQQPGNSVVDGRSPDTMDAAAAEHVGSGTTVVVAESTGFDWADAGIGAAAGLGLAVILLAGYGLSRSRRDAVPAS
jgi:hypothetical protein